MIVSKEVELILTSLVAEIMLGKPLSHASADEQDKCVMAVNAVIDSFLLPEDSEIRSDWIDALRKERRRVLTLLGARP